METDELIGRGFRLVWTADGENYRVAIFEEKSNNLLWISSGSGSEDAVRPTEKNMLDTFQLFTKHSTYATRTAITKE